LSDEKKDFLFISINQFSTNKLVNSFESTFNNFANADVLIFFIFYFILFYFICIKVPRYVEGFIINFIKFKIIISKIIVFPKVFHTFVEEEEVQITEVQKEIKELNVKL